jgi:hypothetical protein
MLSVKRSSEEHNPKNMQLIKVLFDFELTMKQVSFGEDKENASSQAKIFRHLQLMEIEVEPSISKMKIY